MRLPTQAEAYAFGRHVLSYVLGAVSGATVLGILSGGDAATITHSINQIGGGVQQIVSGAAPLVALFTAWYAAWTASHKAQIAAVNKIPGKTVVDVPTDAAPIGQMLGRAGGAIALAIGAGMISLLFMGAIGSAHAATVAKKPDVLTQISTALAQLAAKGTADIQAADALAAAVDPTTGQPADAIGHACYPQAMKFIQSLPKPLTTTAGLGPVQLFEQKRLAVSLVKQGLPSYLVIGCAPLLQDEAVTLTKFLGMLGIAIAIPASGGLALPALPALGGIF